MIAKKIIVKQASGCCVHIVIPVYYFCDFLLEMAVEKLEIETYFGKCKCCLSYGYLRTMWEQHVVEDEIEIYGQMLTKCFSIAVNI